MLLNNKTLQRAFLYLSILLFIYSFFNLLSYHFDLITHPYQQEYREGAIIAATDIILKGKSAYNLTTQPQYINVYGFTYNLFITPIAHIFGASLFLHRLISGFFIFGCVFLCFYHMCKQASHPIYAACASLTIYIALLFPNTSTATAGPHSMGEFLFLLSIFIPIWYKFSYRSLSCALIVSLLAFYTKAYFVIGFPLLAIYLFLFRSKLKGVIAGTSFLIILILSSWIVFNIYDCYFTNAFFTHMNIAQNSDEHAPNQFKAYIPITKELLIILFSVLLINLKLLSKTIKKNKPNLSFSFLKMNTPLINLPVDFISFMLISTTLLVYFKLGRASGSWLAYLFQLISPFIILTIIKLIEKTPKTYYIWIGLILWHITFLSTTRFPDLNNSISNWDKIEKRIEPFNDVFNTPAVVSILLDQNKEFYDNGFTEFSRNGIVRKSIFRGKLHNDMDVLYENIKFDKQLSDKFKEKKFDLLVITENWAPLVPANITKYYKYIDSIQAPMPHSNQTWKVTFWLPKE